MLKKIKIQSLVKLIFTFRYWSGWRFVADDWHCLVKCNDWSKLKSRLGFWNIVLLLWYSQVSKQYYIIDLIGCLFFVWFLRMDEGRQPLSRKLPLPSSRINPYRIVIILRLVILGLFFNYRILHPVNDAFALWLISVICEIWFAVSWIFDQFPKWFPIERETYLDRLSLRYTSPRHPLNAYIS